MKVNKFETFDPNMARIFIIIFLKGTIFIVTVIMDRLTNFTCKFFI